MSSQQKKQIRVKEKGSLSRGGEGGGMGRSRKKLLEVSVLSFHFSPFYEVLHPRKNEPVALLLNQIETT